MTTEPQALTPPAVKVAIDSVVRGQPPSDQDNQDSGASHTAVQQPMRPAASVLLPLHWRSLSLRLDFSVPRGAPQRLQV